MKNILLSFAILFTSLAYAQESPAPIHVEVVGQGDPILLIPGFTVPGESWQSTVDLLKTNYECHIVTLAGFGGKAPIEFPWLPQVNTAIDDYIEAQGLTNVTVIGHSLGGTVALWLASREDNSISQLIVVDALPATGALMFPNFNPENIVYDNPFSNQQLAMSEEDFEQLASGMSQGMSLNSEGQQKVKEWMIQADRKTYVYGYTDYLKLDMRQDLKNITIPVTILAADKPYGKEMVTQTYKTQYANLSEYDLRIADNSAHFIMFDKPEWFMDQIQTVLASK